MLAEEIVASFIVCHLTFHLGVNIWNIMGTRRTSGKRKPPQKTKSPKNPNLALAAIGAMLFWLESLLYPVLAFSGLSFLVDPFPLQLRFPHDSWVQAFGMILTVKGYFLFSCSVIARGKYAISWRMTEQHRLVTWGPYRYVRHLSYLSYFLMILGLLFMLLNLLTIPCLMVIPGYFEVAGEEEKMLLERFGEEYQSYRRKTGRFWPRRSKSSES